MQESQLRIRPAEQKDVPRIWALYRAAAKRPYCTWDETYPGETELQSDLASGGLYVAELDGAFAGAVSIVAENELEDLAFWSISAAPRREISRVVIEDAYVGRGLAVVMITQLLALLKAQGCRAVRLLVAKGNLPAIRIYEKLGFSFSGECYRYDIDFYACEKAL